MKTTIKQVIAVALLCGASSVHAYDFSRVIHVGDISVAQLPAKFSFRTTLSLGDCAAGEFIVYNGKGATDEAKHLNALAVYKAMVQAKIRNKTVKVYGNNKYSASNCVLEQLHINQ